MTDFFSRLAERALNIAPTIQPMIIPLYASEAQHIEDGLLDSVEKQEGQNPATTVATHNTQRAQVAASLPEPQRTQVALPEIQHHALSAAPESATQAAKTPVLADAPHSLQTETQHADQPYPVLQRTVQHSASHIEQQVTAVTTTTAQNGHIGNNKAHTTSYPAAQNPPQSMHEQTDSHFQHSEQHLATTEPLTQKNIQSSSLEHEHMSNLAPTTPLAKGDIPIPVTRPVQAVVSNGATSPLQAINGYHKVQEQQHRRTAKEAPVAPTIQVTIGRIEVRATTSPAPNTTAQRQQVAPPVMSLDDYLNQRAKGGR